MLWSVAIMKINWSRQPQNTKEHGLSQKSDSAEPVDDHGLWNSRPLDVHTWSEHPEVNTFVDEIYREHFQGGNEIIRKKHLKVLLLDLYMAWCDDPDLKIAVHRNTNQYKARSRYNSLHISSITPTIVDRLVEVALIDFHNGFNDRRIGGRSRLSRIWPTEALLDKFQVARFGPLDISHHDGKECIVLRDIDGETVEYKDTPKIRRMREHLKAYNDLLSQTYIDIPSLETNYIDLGIDTNGKPSRLFVNQSDKFVRRIFNRGSWDKGGRFWGGWWQRCPKHWRRYDPDAGQPGIFINDKPTSELDYSGMHIVMLYGQSRINYWADVGTDPYTIKLQGLGFTPERLRSICKLLLLMALNANDEAATFRAFRDNAETGTVEKSLKDKQLKSILDALREKHQPIADKFATDQGINLMRQDSEITARIINHFTSQSIPILTIHDSYIVNEGCEHELDRVMKTAFEEVTGVRGAQLKWENRTSREIIEEQFARRSMDMRNPAFRANLQIALEERSRVPRTDRYKNNYQQFKQMSVSEK